MKKIFTTIAISLLSVSSLSAQGVTLTILADGAQFGGFQPLDISGDGKYICGASFVGPHFIADWEQQECWYPEGTTSQGGELRSITNSGLALGMGGNLIDFSTGQSRRTPLADLYQSIRGGLTDAVTDDGSIITGLAYKIDDPLYYAAYWENGKCHLLPVPTEDQTGWRIYGSRARFISDDGSVIAGYLVDRLSTFPMVYWTRQEDGSYKLHPVCLDYFCDSRDNDKKYVQFCPYAMSPNGKYIVLQLKETQQNGSITSISNLALYDTDTDEIIRCPISGRHGMIYGTHLQVWDHGVANDGTIVGWFEHTYGRSPFIIYPDTRDALKFTEAFPEIEIFPIYDYMGDHAVSCISADGRYIGGCAWHYNEVTDFAAYQCYVVDTGEKAPQEEQESGIAEIGEQPAGQPEYFDISGHRLSAPIKGINIVRYPDGSTKKIIL